VPERGIRLKRKKVTVRLDAAKWHALKAFLISYERPGAKLPPKDSFAMMVISLLNTSEEVPDHDSD